MCCRDKQKYINNEKKIREQNKKKLSKVINGKIDREKYENKN